MFLTKENNNTNKQDISLSFMGDDLVSRMAIILSSISNGTSEIQNISVNKHTKNLINIIKNFKIDINLDNNTNIVSINGNGYFGYQQADSFINIGSSIENLLLILIVVANQEFKTFIIGDKDFSKNDFSCIFDYLENVEIIFNHNRQLPLLCYGKKEFLTRNVFTTKNVFDKGLLLLSSIFSKKNISIVDENLQDETIEKLLSFLGMSIITKYFENTNFLTRNVQKGKDIYIDKTKQATLVGKNYEIPLNIKEVFYTIFLFMFIDNIDEITFSNVSINELNNTIIGILVENGIDIQYKRQRIIMNTIKVSDLVVKKSKLKPISISKDRMKKVLDFYPFLMLLNILNNNALMIYGAKNIREYDEIGYKFIMNILNNFGYIITEVRDNIEFIPNEDVYNKIQYNHIINIADNIKTDISLAFLLSSIKFNNKVLLLNLEAIIDIFPNFNNILKQFNIILND